MIGIMALIKILFRYDAKPACLLIMGDVECVTKKIGVFLANIVITIKVTNKIKLWL